MVVNAASGSGDAEEACRIIRAVFEGTGRPFHLHTATAPDQLPSLIRRAVDDARRTSGAVVAAGGDGTINSVAQQVLPTGLPFGIIPQGTFNYVCRSHGIPLETREAAQALLRSVPRPMQVGRLNARIFLVNASVGLYRQMFEDREAFKREYGRHRLVAYGAAFLTLFRHRHQLRLEIHDGDQQEVVRTPTVFVGNNALQLEQVGLPEANAVRQGRLAVVIVRPISAAGLLWLVARGALGQLGNSENVRDFATRRLVVRTRAGTSRIKVATDGEVWSATTPLEFSVAPEPLQLLVPADAASAT